MPADEPLLTVRAPRISLDGAEAVRGPSFDGAETVRGLPFDAPTRSPRSPRSWKAPSRAR
ncbi:hypothetical protein RND61_00115 [Streptomyces sp. TRM76323]|uniref:Uncharacterized protein n=1 Tax=Streptomyces tamarix TaxID=3078565 RepID=A0ABU3QDQ3_9ACTN|nr:hypothetical protein [Streptomyces tamarix]MDT9680497.1 hypothetical protein [Streptomyces tamarix]